MAITAISYPIELRRIYERLRKLSAPEIYELLRGLPIEKRKQLDGMIYDVPLEKEVHTREVGSEAHDDI